MTNKESSSCRMTHYERLGVSPTASMEAIKAAYHRLARTSHPDKTGVHKNNDFVQLQAAWECLRDTRTEYDQTLKAVARKTSNVIVITEDQLELVQDQDTAEMGYLGTCERCGHELEWWNPDNDNVLECAGCSLMYQLSFHQG